MTSLLPMVYNKDSIMWISKYLDKSLGLILYILFWINSCWGFMHISLIMLIFVFYRIITYDWVNEYWKQIPIHITSWINLKWLIVVLSIKYLLFTMNALERIYTRYIVSNIFISILCEPINCIRSYIIHRLDNSNTISYYMKVNSLNKYNIDNLFWYWVQVLFIIQCSLYCYHTQYTTGILSGVSEKYIHMLIKQIS